MISTITNGSETWRSNTHQRKSQETLEGEIIGVNVGVCSVVVSIKRKL